MGFPRHAALDVGDLDGDGDVDIAAGRFSWATLAAMRGWICRSIAEEITA